MNEMDLLTRFRAEVPLGVSPHAEELFDAGIHDHSAERPVVRAPRNLFARIRMPWRVAIATGLAAGLAVGLVAAIQPSGPPPVLTAKLLADRAAAAALARLAAPTSSSASPSPAASRASCSTRAPPSSPVTWKAARRPLCSSRRTSPDPASYRRSHRLEGWRPAAFGRASSVPLPPLPGIRRGAPPGQVS